MRSRTAESERARLAAVERYAILDTPPEGAFDRVTRLAAQLFDVPIAVINLIDDRRIWFKSTYGLDGVTEVPREPGLCSSAIEHNEPYIVEDADSDPRSAANSLVRGALGVRFYVGVPLVTNDGFALGTLCLLDTKPRLADPAKVEMVAELSKIVVDELELRLAARRLAAEASRRERAEAKAALASRSSLTDELTGIANRRALERELDERPGGAERGIGADGAIVVLDIDGLKAVNDGFGHDAGDALLRAFAHALQNTFAGQPVFRYGGDEFVVMFDSALRSMHVRRDVRQCVRSVRDLGFREIDASFGVATFAEADDSPRAALRLADSRMYAAKVSRR